MADDMSSVGSAAQRGLNARRSRGAGGTQAHATPSAASMNALVDEVRAQRASLSRLLAASRGSQGDALFARELEGEPGGACRTRGWRQASAEDAATSPRPLQRALHLQRVVSRTSANMAQESDGMYILPGVNYGVSGPSSPLRRSTSPRPPSAGGARGGGGGGGGSPDTFDATVAHLEQRRLELQAHSIQRLQHEVEDEAASTRRQLAAAAPGDPRSEHARALVLRLQLPAVLSQTGDAAAGTSAGAGAGTGAGASRGANPGAAPRGNVRGSERRGVAGVDLASDIRRRFAARKQAAAAAATAAATADALGRTQGDGGGQQSGDDADTVTRHQRDLAALDSTDSSIDEEGPQQQVAPETTSGRLTSSQLGRHEEGWLNSSDEEGVGDGGSGSVGMDSSLSSGLGGTPGGTGAERDSGFPSLLDMSKGLEPVLESSEPGDQATSGVKSREPGPSGLAQTLQEKINQLASGGIARLTPQVAMTDVQRQAIKLAQRALRDQEEATSRYVTHGVCGTCCVPSSFVERVAFEVVDTVLTWRLLCPESSASRSSSINYRTACWSSPSAKRNALTQPLARRATHCVACHQDWSNKLLLGIKRRRSCLAQWRLLHLQVLSPAQPWLQAGQLAL